MNWLQSMVYGMISGFVEFLPISGSAHRKLLLLLMGAEDNRFLTLMVHVGALLSLMLSCWPQLAKLQRERRIASIPSRRRKRQPDGRVLKDLRFLKTAIIPLLAGFMLLPWTGRAESLWLTAILLAINGILLYLPPYFPSGNKDSQTVSGLDGVIIGLGGILGVVPGLSRLTGITTLGQLRGCSRSYILDIGLLLSIPAMIVVIVFDIAALIAGGAAMSGGMALGCFLAAAAAFGASYLGITFIRFLAVKVGFSGFAYYSWGAALFTFILYLTI